MIEKKNDSCRSLSCVRYCEDRAKCIENKGVRTRRFEPWLRQTNKLENDRCHYLAWCLVLVGYDMEDEVD